MIPLHVESLLHALGVGETRWVQKDQVVSVAPRATLLTEPSQAISLNQIMAIATEAIQPQVPSRPIQIGSGHIHARGAARAASSRMHGSRCGITEQVEKSLAISELSNTLARRTMIEEQAGIQKIGEIDQEPAVIFMNLQVTLAPIQALILRMATLPLPHLEEHLLRRNVEHLWNHPQC